MLPVLIAPQEAAAVAYGSCMYVLSAFPARSVLACCACLCCAGGCCCGHGPVRAAGWGYVCQQRGVWAGGPDCQQAAGELSTHSNSRALAAQLAVDIEEQPSAAGTVRCGAVCRGSWQQLQLF